MKIVCDATSVVVDAAPDVARSLVERGFTPVAAAAASASKTVAELPLDAVDDLEADDVAVSATDGCGVAAGGVASQKLDAISATSAVEVDEENAVPEASEAAEDPFAPSLFDSWETNKDFLKLQELPDLRAFAAAREVQLPQPANKGQIVNAIVSALAE